MELGIKPEAFAFVAILPLLLFSTLNISHMDGMAGDFSNMIIELVTANSSEYADYSILQMERNSWIVVNLTVPDEDYSMNVLIESDQNLELEDEMPIIEISYSPEFLPDFSNLKVNLVSEEGSQEIGYSFVAMEEGKWAILGLEQTPSEGQTIELFAEYSAPAEDESEEGTSDEESEAPAEEESEDELEDELPEESDETETEEEGSSKDPEDWGEDSEEDEEVPASESNETNQNVTSDSPELDPNDSKVSDDFSFEVFGSGWENASPALFKLKDKGKEKKDFTFIPPKIEDRSGKEVPVSPVLGIEFRELRETGSGRLGLESIPATATPFGKNSKQAYAIDPTSLDFDEAEVTVRAKGRELFKCAEWDFDSRICNGKWVKVMDLVPGELYTFTITPDDPAFAEYNATFGAVRCANYSSPCIANSSLLISRDNIGGTQEPNQPNTLDACTDGGTGTYASDESVENITITSLNGTIFNAGDTVSVEAWVYCWGTGAADNINIGYTPSAASPAWSIVNYTDPCPGNGYQLINNTFVLGSSPGEHAVRVSIQYNGNPATTCGAGAYDDNDDVIFQVNGTYPNVTLVAPSEGFVDCNKTIPLTFSPSENFPNCDLLVDGFVDQAGIAVSAGNNYTFNASMTSGSHTWAVRCGATESQTRNISVCSTNKVFESAFISGGSLSPDATNSAPWQRGNATQRGGCHRDSSCWATGLAANYLAGGPYDDFLTQSSAMNLSNYENATLHFYHYRYFEDATTIYDAGVVEVNNGSGWTRLTPEGGYTGTVDNGHGNSLGNQQAYGNHGTDWELETFNLSSYDGQENVTLRFYFAADSSVGDQGWFIDDMVVVADPNVTYRLYLSDDSDTQTIVVNQTNNFYANYTYLNGTPISGPSWTCNITTNATFNMSYNSSLGLYTHSQSFPTAQNSTFNVSCRLNSSFILLQRSDDFTIRDIAITNLSCYELPDPSSLPYPGSISPVLLFCNYSYANNTPVNTNGICSWDASGTTHYYFYGEEDFNLREQYIHGDRQFLFTFEDVWYDLLNITGLGKVTCYNSTTGNMSVDFCIDYLNASGTNDNLNQTNESANCFNMGTFSCDAFDALVGNEKGKFSWVSLPVNLTQYYQTRAALGNPFAMDMQFAYGCPDCNFSLFTTPFNLSQYPGYTVALHHFDNFTNNGSDFIAVDEANNLNLTRVGTVGIAPGQVNNSINFSTNHGYLVSPDKVGFDILENITVEAYIKSNQHVPQARTIFSKWAFTPLGRCGPYLNESCIDQRSGLVYLDANNHLTVSLTDNGKESGAVTVSDPAEFPTGQWVHIAFSYNGTHIALYRDGVVVGQSDDFAGKRIYDSTSPWVIGASDTGLSGFAEHIQVDELRVIARALSGAELVSHMNADFWLVKSQRIPASGYSFRSENISGGLRNFSQVPAEEGETFVRLEVIGNTTPMTFNASTGLYQSRRSLAYGIRPGLYYNNYSCSKTGAKPQNFSSPYTILASAPNCSIDGFLPNVSLGSSQYVNWSYSSNEPPLEAYFNITHHDGHVFEQFGIGQGNANVFIDYATGLANITCYVRNSNSSYTSSQEFNITNPTSCFYASRESAVYTLGSDLNLTKEDYACITVDTANVTIDCDGYSITGNNSNVTYGILAASVGSLTVRNCTIQNYTFGIDIENSSNHNITNNTMRYNDYGFNLDPSYNNSVVQNGFYNNSVMGLHVDDSFNSTFVTNTYFSNGIGLSIEDSSNNSFINETMYSNGYDLRFNSSIAGAYSNISRMSFLNPAGTLANYTVLSLNDTLAQNSEYFINWTTNESALPSVLTSFEEKYVNISIINGTVSIDSIVWHWEDAELAGYDEEKLQVWKYNFSGWESAGGSLSEAENTLTVTSLNPESIYGLFENPENLTVVQNSPLNHSIDNETSINFNWTATSSGSSVSCNMTIDGTVNQSNIPSNNATPTNYTINGFAEGSHNWSVQCNDSIGKTGTSETWIFYIDLTDPNISFVSPTPTNNSNQSTSCVDINVSVSDDYLNTTTLNFNGSERYLLFGKYRREIIINNSGNNNTLTDYQIRLEIPQYAGMNPDYTDLRFTNGNHTQELTHCVLEIADPAVVWVRVDEIPANTTSSIWLHYGNEYSKSMTNCFDLVFYDEPVTNRYVVSQQSAALDLVVQAGLDNTTIRNDGSGENVTLNQGQTHTFLAANHSATTGYSSTKPFCAAFNASSASDTLVPYSFSGTKFTYYFTRGSPRVYIMPVFGDAAVNASLYTSAGTFVSTTNFTVTNNTVYTYNFANSRTIILESDNPIMVAYSAGTSDSLIFYPATYEIFGMISNSNWVSALENGTNITVYYSDNTSETQSLSRGQAFNVNNGNGAQGTGNVARIVSNKPIGGHQQADSDGNEATTNWGRESLGKCMGTPLDAEYVVVACPVPNTTLYRYNSTGDLVEAVSCSQTTNSSYPGKYRFTNLESGTTIFSNYGTVFYGVFEQQSNDDEQNLCGLLQSRKFTWPEPTYSMGNETVNNTFIQICNLSVGTYTYFAAATDHAGNSVSTDVQTLNIVPMIFNVTDTPDPQGYGLNVTISATVFNASTVLVGITPSGGNETNYSMTNISSTIFIYNYSDWTNGTYSYVIYANDTGGAWDNSSTYNFALQQNLTIQVKTMNDTYAPNQTINLTDPPNIWMGPEILSATLSPEKVTPGDLMKVTVHVKDSNGVASATAYMPHELGTDAMPLSITLGNETDGVWEGVWTVHDTIAREYISIVEVYGKDGEKSEAQIHWFDPPGVWISPSSWVDPTNQWDNEANASDGDTDTYAADNSNPGGGWGDFIIYNTTLINSTSVRVWSDWGAQVNAVDIDVLRNGTWVDVHQGAIPNLAWYQANFTRGEVTAARFRYNYTIGGWIYWLYELQFYNVSTQVNVPVVATRAASSVEETSAILKGVVNADGGTDCQVRFHYGTSLSYGNTTSWQSPLYAGDDFAERLTGLSNGQTYYFLAEINNSAGTANGSSQSFIATECTQGWVTATGYDDPNGEWENEENVFDDLISTEAQSFHDVNDSDGVWSSYLYLNRSPTILSDRIRFNAKAIDTDRAEVDVYANGSWVNVYNNSFADKTYIVATFNQSNVSQARIRLRAENNGEGFYFQLYEFDFYKVTLTPFENQSRLDNNGTTNASCYLQMKTQFWNGSTWIDDDIVVKDSTPRVYAPSEFEKLDASWNPTNYSTSNLSNGAGTYRVYAACLDNESNLLMNADGTYVNASYNFTYDTSPPDVNITSPANNSNYSLGAPVPIAANVTDDIGVTTVQANISNSLGFEIISLSFNGTSGLWEGNYSNTNYLDKYSIQIIATDTSGQVNDTEFVYFYTTDDFAPNVTLVSPPNGNITYNGSVTFTCNVTDNYDVKNVSLYITDKNNASFSFNDSASTSGVSVSVDFNLALESGDYAWNCLAFDSSNNSDWGDVNYTLRVVDMNGCPVIPFPGIYTQPLNYAGAPNNASPLSDTVCVKIASSDVTYDCAGNTITNNGTGGTTYGILLNGSLTNVSLLNCGVHNYTSGIYLYQSNDSSLENITLTNNTNGLVFEASHNNTVANLTSENNTGYGILLNQSDDNAISDSNSTSNGDGIYFDSQSDGNSLYSDYICFNGYDVDDQGSNSGQLDTCDTFAGWSENGHLGCEFACSNFWHRFFGNVNGSIILTDSVGANNVYSWNTSALQLYFTDADANISWGDLQAIGLTTANASSSNDFTELDSAFGGTAFTDNINATYSTDGSAPIETQNYTVYQKLINYVPVANSSRQNTTFQTGILWDANDGGTEYSNAVNQSTVWMVAVNTSTPDAYGTYDFLIQVPYTLADYEGATSEVAIWMELQ